MKSQDKILLQLGSNLVRDCNQQCGTDAFSQRDIDTLVSRFKHEGSSFMTITLPTFCQDFERSLANSRIDSTFFQGFRKNGSTPAFLRGMISLVFDRLGNLLPNPSITAIRCIRQICLFAKKIKRPCDSRRVAATLKKYKETEEELHSFVLPPDVDDLKFVFETLFSGLDNLVIDPTLAKHGPGTSAEMISLPNQKTKSMTWYSRLDNQFSFSEYVMPFMAYFSDGEVDIESVRDEPSSRVICVPKTMKSPRVIAAEPLSHQFCQQAVKAELTKFLEKRWKYRGQINFTDQKVNQRLVLQASHDEYYASVDLSDASDRVHYEIVRHCLKSFPIWDWIDACRTRYANLEGENIHLAKFASMGSALCFPIESMYFYALCVLAQMKVQCLPITAKSVRKSARTCFVYGDDLVVPSTTVPTLIETFKTFCLKVNQHKTFYTGKFRESCGTDAYDGHRVTPVYLRSDPPSKRTDASEVVSYISTARQLDNLGFSNCASFMYKLCEGVIGRLPITSDTTPVLGISQSGVCQFLLNSFTRIRTNGKSWAREVHGWTIKSRRKSDSISGYEALSDCLRQMEHYVPNVGGVSKIKDRIERFILNERDLSESTVRGVTTLQRRWMTA